MHDFGTIIFVTSHVKYFSIVNFSLRISLFIDLIFHVSLEKPTIVGGKEELIYVQQQFENVIMRCPSLGAPKPLIFWHFNGEMVQDGSQDRFIGFDGRLILTKVLIGMIIDCFFFIFIFKKIFFNGRLTKKILL